MKKILLGGGIGVAIIAILIIFVATQSSCLGCGGISAIDAISNGLSSVGPNHLRTQEFSLNPGTTMQSDQFDKIGFYKQSIVFAIATTFPKDFAETGIENDQSFFKYTKNSPIKVRAKIYCEQNGTSLQQTLKLTESKYQNAQGIENITPLCGEKEYQPCCIVIIERA